MLKSSPWLALALVALSYTPGAWAWGAQGHHIIGAIADRLLSAPARAQVARLLADDRDKYGRASGRDSLEAVAVWADEISSTPQGHPRWHYDDVAVCGAVAPERYCPGGECLSAALTSQSAVLADAHAAARERNEALKWVVHLVGDVHQPLHAADNDDRGGNRVSVALGGVRTRGRASLHKVWDTDLVRLAFDTRGTRTPSDVAGLAREAQQLAAAAGEGSTQDWVRQSNNLARNVAYRYPGFACGEVPEYIVVLDGTYRQDAEQLVRERVLLAGARLAALLNRVLAVP